MRCNLFAYFVALAIYEAASVGAVECTVGHNSDGLSDDSPAISKAFADCALDSVITFEQVNYTSYTPIALTGLSNVTVLLNGNILLPNNISRVQQEINATINNPSAYGKAWIYIQGADVQIIGSQDSDWGQFHGFGQQWWDIGNRILRPQLATFNVTGGFLRNLKVIKPIAWGFSIPGKNVRVENHFVDAMPYNGTRDTTISFPFNTDGFNLSGQNITIDGYYGHNGDDCVSVIHGARDIVAMNGYCGFSSHGLSIGSLGREGFESQVENVLFKNWTMEGAVYGARFKSWTGGRGFANNITWEDITLENVSTAVFITQNYYDQDKGPRPDNVNKTSTKISNFLFRNFKGSLAANWTDGSCISDPCWNYVEGIDNTKSVILDLFPDTATAITVENIDVHPLNSSEVPTVLCDPAALSPGMQDILGFKCQNGPFVATAVQATGAAHALKAYLNAFHLVAFGLALWVAL